MKMESKHTKEEVFQNGNNGIHDKQGNCIALTYGENRKDNAILIRDAFNVTNETGLTPRELQKSHAELLEALKLVYEQSGIVWDSKPSKDFEVGCMLHIITKAIKNATKDEK